MTPGEGSPASDAGAQPEPARSQPEPATRGEPGQVLDEILAGVREDVARRQEEVPLERVKRLAAAAAPPKDGYAALRAAGVGVIAEVKRSSPSRGKLADIPDPA